MKRLLIPLFISILVPAHTFAQSYLSKTPVDNGSYQVPPNISGTWKEQRKADDGQTFTIMVNANSTGTLFVLPKNGVMLPAVMSALGGKIFVSIYDAGTKERPEGYFIYRLSAADGYDMRLVPLKQDLVIPKKLSLKDYLQKADTADIDAPYGYWFGNVNRKR